MTRPTDPLTRVWRSVKLCIGYHRDRDGNRRSKPWIFQPKDAQVAIHPDPSNREAVVVVEGADRQRSNDVSIRLRPDRILLRRKAGASWEGIVIEEQSVVVLVNGIWIWINSDGSISHEKDGDKTHIDADGTVVKTTDAAESLMSADGIELSRRTASAIAAIREDSVVARFAVAPSGKIDEDRIDQQQDS